MHSQGPHPSEDLIAALVDGQLDREEDQRITEHLSRCRSCMATYAEAVRQVDRWRSDPRRSTGIRTGVPGSSIRKGTRILLAACVPLLALLAVRMVVTRPSPGPDFAKPSEEVLAVLASASHNGLVLPGAGQAIWNPQPLTRSGTGGNDLVGEEEADTGDHPKMAPIYEIGSSLAAGRRDLARNLLDSERSAGHDDADLRVLNGILSYQELEVAEAEKDFRAALEERPGDPVARFNLAFVLAELGKNGEAAALFEQLASDEDHDLIRHRAEIELGRIGKDRP